MPEAPQYRDRLPAAYAGEARVLATFTPTRAAYLRSHLDWAAFGAVVSVVVLLAMGRAHTIWAALLGIVAALGLRGWMMVNDAMRVRWLLTEDALIGPGADVIARADIAQVRRLFRTVQVTTRGGRHVLIRYLPDPDAAVAAIRTAR